MARKSALKTKKTQRSEFTAALAQVSAERRIDPEQVYLAIEAGLVGAYRKQAGGENDIPLDPAFFYWGHVDRLTGEMYVFRAPRLFPDDPEDERYDDTKVEDVTPSGFGRIAAQLAKQIIIARMRDAEREQIIGEYQNQIGQMITAQVFRMERGVVWMDVGRGNAAMPPREQMRGEFYKSNARLAVLIKEIGEVAGHRTIIVSRSDPKLVELLFEREVPEIASGAVQIRMIAREAGIRTKLAVSSNQPQGVDPVGSCVGQRGVRVQEIIKELNNEKIDIIPYYDDKVQLIAAALAPAENLSISYDEKTNTATVRAPADQISLAIGRGGQNVRLAGKLLKMSITIVDEAGSVAGQVSGQEEYEIDSFGLEEAVREELINLKLTNSNDIVRFQNRLQDNEVISDEVKQAILERATKQVETDYQNSPSLLTPNPLERTRA